MYFFSPTFIFIFIGTKKTAVCNESALESTNLEGFSI